MQLHLSFSILHSTAMRSKSNSSKQEFLSQLCSTPSINWMEWTDLTTKVLFHFVFSKRWNEKKWKQFAGKHTQINMSIWSVYKISTGLGIFFVGLSCHVNDPTPRIRCNWRCSLTVEQPVFISFSPSHSLAGFLCSKMVLSIILIHSLICLAGLPCSLALCFRWCSSFILDDDRVKSLLYLPILCVCVCMCVFRWPIRIKTVMAVNLQNEHRTKVVHFQNISLFSASAARSHFLDICLFFCFRFVIFEFFFFGFFSAKTTNREQCVCESSFGFGK